MTLGDIEEDNKETEWAKMAMTQYYYRKLFGLSFEEWQDEPFDALTQNMAIDAIIKDLESKQWRKTKK